MKINLRGKPFFPGLQAVLVSPNPIKVLAVFSTYKKLREEFILAANQVQLLGTGFRVFHAQNSIETPIGSKLFFAHVETPDDSHRLNGLEIHDFWVDDALESNAEIMTLLSCRARL